MSDKLERKFVTPYGRLRRIEALMKIHRMNWSRLSKAMNVTQISAQRSFQKRPNGTYADPSLSTIEKAARALGVTAGFLIDAEVPDVES